VFRSQRIISVRIDVTDQNAALHAQPTSPSDLGNLRQESPLRCRSSTLPPYPGSVPDAPPPAYFSGSLAMFTARTRESTTAPDRIGDVLELEQVSPLPTAAHPSSAPNVTTTGPDVLTEEPRELVAETHHGFALPASHHAVPRNSSARTPLRRSHMA
jgi:hypothetical protein